MGFIADNYGVEQTSPVVTDAYHFTTTYGEEPSQAMCPRIKVHYGFTA